MPREIHSPPQPDTSTLEKNRALEDRVKKLQKDCQILSSTVSGQAAKIREQESQIAELNFQCDSLKDQAEVKLQEVQNLKSQLEEALNVPPVKIPEPERIVEVREVVQYVEKSDCASCDRLTSEKAALEELNSKLKLELESLKTAK